MKEPKKFLTYEQQIDLLKSKNLYIGCPTVAINFLKHHSYYSLISGYKDIFKIEKNGNYRPNTSFEDIATLYLFDEALRLIFLENLIKIEKHIKSLYSYAFCELYGDEQSAYLNVNNYNYITKNQNDINEYIAIVNKLLKHPQKFPNINYNIQNYGSVPLWVLLPSLTFGNISKLYSFSKQKLQSQVAREFKDIYSNDLSDILNVLTKFRNVCAHGERLYNYKTQKSLPDLPMHRCIRGKYSVAKNDLFNVCICFKYLLSNDEFIFFVNKLSNVTEIVTGSLNCYYKNCVFSAMGFPDNWKEILLNN